MNAKNLLVCGTLEKDDENFKKVLKSDFKYIKWSENLKWTELLHKDENYLLIKIDRSNDQFQKEFTELLSHHKGTLLNTKCLVWADAYEVQESLLMELLKEYSDYTFFMIDKEFNVNSLGNVLDKLKNQNLELKEIYFHIPGKLILTMNHLPADVYIKISGDKYIKILKKGDDFNIIEVISKYTKKGIDEYYVQSQDYGLFKNVVVQEIFKNVQVEKKTIIGQMKVSDSVLSVVKALGVSEQLIEEVNENFGEILTEVQNQKSFSKLLEMFSVGGDSLIVKHSHLTALFCHLIINKTPWSNIKIRKNLSLASLLHDSELYGTEFEKYEFKYLSEIDDKKLLTQYMNHPKTLATNLSGNHHVPDDVLKIILNHHDGLGDLGFPAKKHGNQLAPIICVFITAHTFSIELTRFKFNLMKLNEVKASTRSILKSKVYAPFLEILESEVVGI